MPDLRARLIAESVGTFALVFVGTGAIVIDQASNGVVGHLGIALSFGLVVMAMIYAFGEVSGAHINPAVTLGFYFSKRLPGNAVLPYIGAQVAGAVLASLFVRTLFPAHPTLGATLPAGTAMQSFLLEIVLTFILMLVILRVATGARETGIMAGAAIGSVVGFAALFAGPISGASMNPARSLAPALVSGHLQDVWIYLLAPFLGAVLAIPVCKLMKTEGCCEPETARAPLVDSGSESSC